MKKHRFNNKNRIDGWVDVKESENENLNSWFLKWIDAKQFSYVYIDDGYGEIESLTFLYETNWTNTMYSLYSLYNEICKKIDCTIRIIFTATDSFR